ncbi:hypothetical protein GE061_000680 [Apolygus lucorum]|uniref:Uncharacterized protein n=1 Tax=Apolygus lucorum TaxID=248454 RepID=A0A6A4JZN4_APOLU|nr:hypothetical protein GE061_000680 [Apolygus lucorum]
MCGSALAGSDASADELLWRMTEVVNESGKEWLNLPPFTYNDMENRFHMSASRGNFVSIDEFVRYNAANTTVYDMTLYLNIPVHWVGLTAEYTVNYTGDGGDCSYKQKATANQYDEPVITVWVSVAQIASGICSAELDQIQPNSIDDPTLGPPVPDTCGAAHRDDLNSVLSDRFLFDFHYTALSFLTSAVNQALVNLNLCSDLMLLEGNEEMIMSETGVKY